MHIRKIINAQAEDFLKKNFSSPTHWPDWNILVAKYYNTYFYYLGAFKKNELKGVCPVHETTFKRFLLSQNSGQFHLIPNGGWLFSEPVRLNKKFFPVQWNAHFQSFSLPEVPEFNIEHDQNAGQIKKTLIIDLAKSLDEIWQQDIHSKRRNMIRKAEKAEITVKHLKTEAELQVFHQLYDESAQNFSKHQLSYDFFREMFFNSSNIELGIFAAYQDEKQLANVGIVSDKNYSFYWLGNNANKVKNLGQGELLQWHAIKKMKEKGCKYYDLCYIEPEKLPHIYKFKKGFTKMEEDVAVINKRPITFKILNKINKWF